MGGWKHSDCPECWMGSEIAELALGSPTQNDYRHEVLRRLVSWTGSDSGRIHKHYPSTAPLEPGTYEGTDPHYTQRCVAGWDVQYGNDMAPVVQQSYRLGGVANDIRPFRERNRLAFYADILDPSRIHDGLFCIVE